MFKLPKPHKGLEHLTKDQVVSLVRKYEAGLASEEEKAFLQKLTPDQVNPCDGCNICCITPSIQEDRIGKAIKEPKPACSACPNLGQSGCSTYEDRPDVCKDYLCAYAIGCTDIHPMRHGVAWSFKVLSEKNTVVGHALDVNTVFRSSELVDLMVEMSNTEGIHGLVVSDGRKVVMVNCETGECFGGAIDQTAPLKDRYVEGSFVKLCKGIPHIV
jgi:hypothetical protein